MLKRHVHWSQTGGWLRASAVLGLLAIVALLSSCEGEVAGVGGEGSGGVSIIGRVDGFGSTIVEGQRLDDASALVDVDVGTAQLLAAPLTAVKLGAQLSVLLDGGKLGRAVVSPEVVGRIDVSADLAADSVQVLGQRVLLKHPLLTPVLDGVNDMAAGTVIEVHGLRLSNGDLAATRLQVRSPLLQGVQLSGTVSELDTVAKSFRLHGVTVSYAAAAVNPSDAAPANGQRVTVFSAQDRVLPTPAGLRINAVALRIDSARPLAAAGTDLQLTGFATDLVGTRLRVRGQSVEAGEARITGGTLAALRADQLLRVRGLLQDGLLRAREITVLAAQAAVQIDAPVADYSDADNSFRMRGTNVRFDAATQLVGGTAENLGNGVVLRVLGRIEQGDVVATRVQFSDSSPVMAGVAANIDTAAGTFRLPPSARVVRVNAATAYRNGTAVDVANGQRLRVTGTVQGNELLASEIVFVDVPTAPLAVVLAGTLSDVQTVMQVTAPAVTPQSVTRVFVNDTPVRIDGATSISGGGTNTIADLDAGLFAIVRAVRQNNVLVARSIDIRATLDDDSDNLLGYVSDVRSLADLRVGGQRIDASQAVIAGGTAASLRDTAYVLVEGSMANGVLVARRIELLPN
jgi:hypothetical protein